MDLRCQCERDDRRRTCHGPLTRTPLGPSASSSSPCARRACLRALTRTSTAAPRPTGIEYHTIGVARSRARASAVRDSARGLRSECAPKNDRRCGCDDAFAAGAGLDRGRDDSLRRLAACSSVSDVRERARDPVRPVDGHRSGALRIVGVLLLLDRSLTRARPDFSHSPAPA